MSSRKCVRKVFNYHSRGKKCSSVDCVTTETNYTIFITWKFYLFCIQFYLKISIFSFHSRYIAVTQPIKYAKHKNSRRVCLTILLVWAISAAIGSPIVLGLNNTPDRLPDLCLFYNSDFIVYSSLSSFYIPCIIMVFLYWSIFKVRDVFSSLYRRSNKSWDLQAFSMVMVELTYESYLNINRNIINGYIWKY